MKRGQIGKWIQESAHGRDYDAFVPNNLPPNPSLQWSPTLVHILGAATAAVARLDGAAHNLPDLKLFIYSYVRKEAVFSSQIEGTQSSLSDLLMHESEIIPGVPIDDVSEVSRYVTASTKGIEKVRNGTAINKKLILELHKILLLSGRGSDKEPGKIRVTQNWIGGKTPNDCIFVPPPPNYLDSMLENLLHYIEKSKEPTLIKAAIAHLQFETIHPFRDGNGRIGRLLITLLLCQENLIKDPLIYLSLYLKQNRSEYYSYLQKVRLEGDWESWLIFFLQGVSEVATHAYQLTTKVRELFRKDAENIRKMSPRKQNSTLELHRIAKQIPIFTAAKAEKLLAGSISKPTLYKAAEQLCELGILQSKLSEKGTQIFYYKKYLDLLTD